MTGYGIFVLFSSIVLLALLGASLVFINVLANSAKELRDIMQRLRREIDSFVLGVQALERPEDREERDSRGEM